MRLARMPLNDGSDTVMLGSICNPEIIGAYGNGEIYARAPAAVRHAGRQGGARVYCYAGNATCRSTQLGPLSP